MFRRNNIDRKKNIVGSGLGGGGGGALDNGLPPPTRWALGEVPVYQPKTSSKCTKIFWENFDGR